MNACGFQLQALGARWRHNEHKVSLCIAILGSFLDDSDWRFRLCVVAGNNILRLAAGDSAYDRARCWRFGAAGRRALGTNSCHLTTPAFRSVLPIRLMGLGAGVYAGSNVRFH